ncbi:mono/diheme cytochrome c family protein [Duganella sp. 1224]|uniref:c-type cytochrome n=1 Tax=Duganella sp. 1224 TaxID=2587052 RepID=UPI0015CDD37C|nr:c-type cytochrome [Duganella sp. 1224]NYE60673.1 mono/diheme cytochrome c family protein [Duganella sp. 1224]
MKTKYWVWIAGVLVAGAAAAAAWVIQPAIAPIQPPAPNDFDSASVARGARVVAQGDCMVCHTAAGGAPYAGGLPLRTPFGTIYTTNITPDAATGIGNWSLAAFTRALRHGVSRDGHLLYPAFPYIHYTRMSSADITDAYAYLMTRTPVVARAPDNDLLLPLRFRPLLAGWNLLYLHPGPVADDPRQSAEWNRGRYLVDGAGHCASCHSTLDPIGGERSPAFSGGNIDGWDAPALTALLQTPKPWNREQLALYLRHGWSPEHGAAAGPMGPVAHSLSQVPEADTNAIATYIMSLQKPAAPATATVTTSAPAPAPASAMVQQGAALFAGACAGCHSAEAPMMSTRGRPSLALSSAVTGERPDNLIQVVLNGIPWSHTGQSTFMPPFAAALTDQQIASIAAYVRADIGKRPAWPEVERRVNKIRKENQQ